MNNLKEYIVEKFKISNDVKSESIGTVKDLSDHTYDYIYYPYSIDNRLTNGLEEYLYELDIDELNIDKKYYSTLPVFFYISFSGKDDVYLMSFIFVDKDGNIYDKIPEGSDLKNFYLTPGKPLKNLKYKIKKVRPRVIDEIYKQPLTSLNNSLPFLSYNLEFKEWSRIKQNLSYKDLFGIDK